MMASQPVHLYYWPTSFYSQKALVVLDEKNVNYKSTVINLKKGDQNEPWYLRMNKEGQVPVLKVGEDCIIGSETIMDVVDTLNNAPVLVPSPSTAEGALVKEWRARLADINIEGVTFGVILNPELAVGELQVPPPYRMTKEDFNKWNEKSIEKLEAMKAKHPDLQDALGKKIAKKKSAPAMLEKAAVVGLLESLERLFDDLEVQLRKSRTENIVEHWLCGPNFTVADISLAVTLGRLLMLGLHERYLLPEKRPALVEYWNQLKRRPSITRFVLGAGKALKLYMLKTVLTKVATGAAVAGGVVALGAVIGHKYKS